MGLPLTKCQVDNVIPSDVCYGRSEEMKTRREKINRRTLRESKCLHQLQVQEVFSGRKVSLYEIWICVPKGLTAYSLLCLWKSNGALFSRICFFFFSRDKGSAGCQESTVGLFLESPKVQFRSVCMTRIGNVYRDCS